MVVLQTEPTQYSLKPLKIPDSYYFVLGGGFRGKILGR